MMIAEMAADSTGPLVILTPSFFPTLCGMTYAAHDHATAIRATGRDVFVLYSQTGGGLAYPNQRNTDGVTEIPMNLHGSGLPWNRISGDVPALKSMIDAINPEIILSEGWYTWGTHLLPNLAAPGRRLYLMSHGSIEPSRSQRPIDLIRSLGYAAYNQRYRRRILASLAGAGLLSAYRDDGRFRDHLLFSAQGIKQVVVPNTSMYDGENSKPRSNRRSSVVVIGEMCANKNQLAALEVCAKSTSVRHLTFIYPSENEYAERVRSCARRINAFAVDYVVGLGREALKAKMVAADLILLTSRTEAQPLVLIDGLFLHGEVGVRPARRGPASRVGRGGCAPTAWPRARRCRRRRTCRRR